VVDLVTESGPPAGFDTSDLRHGEPAWAEYVRGVAWALGIGSGRGWEGAIASDVPIGAGLSSSASLEIAAALVFDALGGGDLNQRRLAEAAQRAENEWVGMECGIMDQLSVATAEREHALLIDCRSLRIRHVPVPPEAGLVVLDTSTRRELTSSGYNERRATCDRAAADVGVASLRELDLDDLTAVEGALDDVAGRRVRHVVTENARVLAAAEGLEHGDLDGLGRLMTESHRSLRDDFEVSRPEVDAMVAIALDTPRCLGARMTGGGFGGCAIALVHADAVGSFAETVASRYREATGLVARTYRCVPADGAALITPPEIRHRR
jgi:galactokinase